MLDFCTKVKRYLEPFRGSGKTLAVTERAKQILEKGEKVAIVVKEPFLWKYPVYNFDPKQENVKIIKFSDVRAKIDGLEVFERDPIICSLAQLEGLKDYRVLIDPECYEVLIYELIAKLEVVNKKLGDVQRCLYR